MLADASCLRYIVAMRSPAFTFVLVFMAASFLCNLLLLTSLSNARPGPNEGVSQSWGADGGSD
jgi:hypothetical protein